MSDEELEAALARFAQHHFHWLQMHGHDPIGVFVLAVERDRARPPHGAAAISEPAHAESAVDDAAIALDQLRMVLPR